MTLTEFLLARIAEDEAVARAATPGPWLAGTLAVGGGRAQVACNDCCRQIDTESLVAQGNLTHIARHDPTRVLAECEAKRWVIELASQAVEEATKHGKDRQIGAVFEGRASLAEAMLRAEATSYADHEDYLPEWKP